MKAKVIMFLHLYGLDVILLGLVEKLLLALIKILAEWKKIAALSLERCRKRNP